MLSYLAIENFALIERLEVEFGPGLTLVTGETGSGKSILVDALGQLLGRRASLELVRAGADKARVTGLFHAPQGACLGELLEPAGIELEPEGQLQVRREISQTGANKIFINGVLSTQGLLSELGGRLADIHGQHEQQSLLQARTHLRYLDQYAGLSQEVAQIGETFRHLSRLRHELQRFESEERERLLRLDSLRFQIEDIDRLKLRPGLLEKLEEERSLLGSAEKRLQNARAAYQLLYENEPSLLGKLEKVRAWVEDLAALDPRISTSPERIQEAAYQLQEIAFELRDYLDGIEFDPERLEAVQARLAEIGRARKKYGDSVEEILALRRHAEEEVQELEAGARNRARVEQELARLETHFQEQAEQLAQTRRRKASDLEKEVESELAELAMEAACFQVHFQTLEEPSEAGLDEVDFLFSANPGEPPRPLVKVASGGELSRIILGLKSILSLDRYPKTLVFDEVDAGIGGRVAGTLGEKLSALARHNQVFCVTHLAQVAARADHHFFIDKLQREGRTIVTLEPLDDSDRIQELARMLTGNQVTPTTLKQARELISGRS